jgi:hypothetical protein
VVTDIQHTCTGLSIADKLFLIEILFLRNIGSVFVRAESQQIAAWKLLYRVQHPARYVSRLQTSPSSDIELEFTHDRPQETAIASLCRYIHYLDYTVTQLLNFSLIFIPFRDFRTVSETSFKVC